MKLNHKFVRTVTTTAAVLGAAAMLSVGAFAAEADINDPAAAGIPFYRFYSCDSFYYAIFTALSRSFSNFPRSAHPVHLRCS